LAASNAVRSSASAITDRLWKPDRVVKSGHGLMITASAAWVGRGCPIECVKMGHDARKTRARLRGTEEVQAGFAPHRCWHR
jgi:hypothetical protein